MSDALFRAARREERRAVQTLEDLRSGGPPVRLRDLCVVTGFSKMKFFSAIDAGDLRVSWVKTGQTRMALIERSEALRYLLDINFAA